MSKFVSLHFAFSQGPGARGTGVSREPKSISFGNATRDRISSATIANEVRHNITNSGIRTKIQWVIDSFCTEENKANITKNFEEVMKLVDDVPVLISNKGMENLKALCENAKTKPIKTEDFITQVFEEGIHNGAMALFGRMVASDPKQNTVSAVMNSHAIGVTSSTKTKDFFTAVDDFSIGTGASHTGWQELCASTFYRFSGLDCKQLFINTNKNPEIYKEVAAKWARENYLANPKAKQTGMATPTIPDFVMVVIGEGQPLSLFPAFLEPIEKSNVMQEMIGRMVNYQNKVQKITGFNSVAAYLTTTDYAGVGTKLETLDDLMKFVVSNI